MELTLLDIAFISIAFISSFLGFFKGGVNVLLGIITFIASIFSASYLNIFVANVLKEYIIDYTTIQLLSYFIAFLLGYAAISIMLSPILVSVSAFSVSFVNKFLGIFAGFFRGAIINIIILLLLLGPIIWSLDEKQFNSAIPKWIQTSIVFTNIKHYIPYVKIQQIAKQYLQTKEEKEQDDLEKTIFQLQQ